MKYIYITLFTLVFAACQSPKEKSLANIKALEENDSAFSDSLSSKLKEAYVSFATEYPDDASSPEFLFKAAQRSVSLNKPEESVSILSNLIKQYPKSSFCEEALFLMAYTQENSLNQLQEAKISYEQFIALYPKSELAEDAMLALKNLGKTPEELIP